MHIPEAVLIMGPGLAMSLLGIILGNTLSSTKEYWYDPVNWYVRFPPEFTTIIDKILMDPDFGKIGPGEVVSARSVRPIEGIHYFFDNPLNERNSSWKPNHYYRRRRSVGLEKKIVAAGNDKKIATEHYLAWRIGWNEDVFRKLLSLVFPRNPTQIWIRSIDTSVYEPRICGRMIPIQQALQHQRDAVELILNSWRKSETKNKKVMLYGKRGTGKTYTAKLLKMAIDANGEQMAVLYDNFKPNVVGLNIQTLALDYASPHTPVIVVTNEIDQFYDKVYSEPPSHDPRSQYTADKASFNDMLDVLDQSPNTIVIFTTEVDPKDIYAEEKYRSFIRSGRVDMFIEMTTKTAKEVSHLDIGFKAEDILTLNALP